MNNGNALLTNTPNFLGMLFNSNVKKILKHIIKRLTAHGLATVIPISIVLKSKAD